MTREQFLRRLDAAWGAFRASYAGLPEADLLRPGVTGPWSVRDLIAHVTWWEEEALKHLPVILAGKRPPRYSTTYGGIDAFNALKTEETKGLSLTDVLRRQEEVHARVVALVVGVPESEVATDTRFRRRLRSDTYGHYPKHTAAIVKWRGARRAALISDVVFIHGLYQALGHLREIPFPASARVLVVDLLGFGEHAEAVPPPTLHAQAEHVASELDRHGIARAAIVGHSIGGAVAMLLAAAHPDRVASVVNVEGNFTLADAFWSSKLAAMTAAEVEAVMAAHRRHQFAWFAEQRIESTPRRVELVRRMFEAQPARAVRALAKAAVEDTSRPGYLPTIERVLDYGIPVHLFAGERSRATWSVPESFVRRAASFTTQSGVGHMMPIEEPEEFLRLVAALLP